jgi:transcriptional regulator with XRE-family HTH domain
MGKDSQTIGDVIRDARMKLDLSLRDVTGKLDITPSYLSDIENNRRVPSEEVLRKLADLLKLDYDDLMARAGRFGAEAIRYMQRTPAAGVLLRRLAQANAPRETVEKLIKVAAREIGKDRQKAK